MQIIKSGAHPPTSPSADYFRGQVSASSRFGWAEPSRLGGGVVDFSPGARTAWHTHPLGQTLFVTSGRGWVQRWGDHKQEISVGDVIYFEPGEKHWHGATATTGLTHIAVAESLDGLTTNWMEHVTDAQYSA
jgi:quercetin dioxygenase-like cupin family protein